MPPGDISLTTSSASYDIRVLPSKYPCDVHLGYVAGKSVHQRSELVELGDPFMSILYENEYVQNKKLRDFMARRTNT
jgi:hypothetical protein